MNVNERQKDISKVTVSVLHPGAGADSERVQQLAVRLGLQLVLNRESALEAGVFLLLDEKGLALTDGSMEYRGDFTSMLSRIKQGRLQGELLVKAAKIRRTDSKLIAVDATAGLGEDSLLLAASGFQVLLCESDPIIAALLRDSMERASQVPELSESISGMTLHECDSVDFLNNLEFTPDLVYLDPMFPERKKSGLIKKKFQLLHVLEAPCENGEELVRAAVAASPQKIVIKRPLKAESLAGIKPGYSIKGKSIRYDCIIPPPKQKA